MISAQTRPAFVARENRFPLFRIMLSTGAHHAHRMPRRRQHGPTMAGKLLDGGHELWVCDVREEAMLPLLERQARRAASPKELADTCDTIIVSLPTLEIFRR